MRRLVVALACRNNGSRLYGKPLQNLDIENRKSILKHLIECFSEVEVIEEIEGMTEYELPDYLLGKIWKGKYRGQRQKWFVIRFLGHDQDINLNTSKPEFIEWKWTNIDDLPSIIVDFKKKLYMNLVPKIKLIIG